MTATSVEMTQEECCNCHIVFWMPTSLYRQCQEQKPHKSFFCPNGHGQHYRGENEADKERRLRQRAEQETARLAEEAAAAVRHRLAAERTLKRHQKRAAAGTCPCCNRTFSNMTRHMKTQHPDFASTNVVELKKA